VEFLGFLSGFLADFWLGFLLGIFGGVGDFWRVWGFLAGLGIFGGKGQKWVGFATLLQKMVKLGFDILRKFVIF